MGLSLWQTLAMLVVDNLFYALIELPAPRAIPNTLVSKVGRMMSSVTSAEPCGVPGRNEPPGRLVFSWDRQCQAPDWSAL
jgi:hypothetical protein